LELTLAWSISWAFSPVGIYISLLKLIDFFYRYDLEIVKYQCVATFLFQQTILMVDLRRVAPDGNIYFIERTSSQDTTAYLAAILCPIPKHLVLKGIYSFPITNYWFSHLFQ
jgi:hypothetical protein